MSANRTLRVTKDEWTFFGTLLPYIAMILGALLVLLLGFITRLGVTIQHELSNTQFTTAAQYLTITVLVSCIILSTITWKLFKRRRGLFIPHHATATSILCHMWLLMAIWENSNGWMFSTITFYTFFYGAIILGLSWCIRKWAFTEEPDENPFEAIGLGDAYLDKKESAATPTGKRFRLKLPYGKTIEQAKDAMVKIAHIAKKPRSQVHVRETDSGIEGQVDVFIQDEAPFQTRIHWIEPDYPGHSIASPISYATYDDGTRPDLYLSGKNGASSQHFLTMGMPGTGKSKAWQIIYGTALCRREVSVVFGDPAKGMQTGGPLAMGLEWFAVTEDECHEQIQAIMRAISARTDYLTSKGLSHWEPGCGINFLIFHLEEAARFADVDDLIKLVEAARSAGITIVLSLQRATGDRVKTSTRYNLGGRMCFGVRDKRDASLGLSESSIINGAAPHRWQDRYPGRHYVEAAGLDEKMLGRALETDYIKDNILEAQINLYADERTPLDETTANAFGEIYFQYRHAVEQGTTPWQTLRTNRSARIDNTQEIPAVRGTVAESKVTNKPSNLAVSPEEKQQAENELWELIESLSEQGQHRFAPRDLIPHFHSRTPSWITKKLKSWVTKGRLEETGGMYSISSNFQEELPGDFQ